MKYWKVTVLAEGYEGALDDLEKIQRAYVSMLLEAEDGEAAFQIGKELAECSPALSPAIRWKSFEPVSAKTIGMPLFIDDLTGE
jgi:hypothetical protein